MTNITGEQIAERVRELAQAEPDYVYRALMRSYGRVCSYVTGADGQGCIVGQALTSLGFYFGDEDPGVDVETLLVAREIPSLATTSDWLLSVQNHQDAGIPWGEAVARADRGR